VHYHFSGFVTPPTRRLGVIIPTSDNGPTEIRLAENEKQPLYGSFHLGVGGNILDPYGAGEILNPVFSDGRLTFVTTAHNREDKAYDLNRRPEGYYEGLCSTHRGEVSIARIHVSLIPSGFHNDRVLVD
jgi:hypothetical protein